MNSKPLRSAIALGMGFAGVAWAMCDVASARVPGGALLVPWQIAAVPPALPLEPVPLAPPNPPSAAPPNPPPVVPPTPDPVKKETTDPKSAPLSPGGKESARPAAKPAPVAPRSAEEASTRAADPKDPSGALIIAPPPDSGAKRPSR